MSSGRPFGEGSFCSFVEILRYRAADHPTKRALAFLTDGDQHERWWTYAELDRKARSVAARLQDCAERGERALLLYPPGLEFIAAFHGCLYAGLVAVPAYLPRSNRPSTSLEAIAADAAPRVVLTTGDAPPGLQERYRQHHPPLADAQWLDSDRIDPQTAGAWRMPDIGRDTLACLQYTSGSTARPKGVMLTHGNLLSNSQAIYEAFGHGSRSVGVIWLPPFHDMGLIGGILQPLYGGFPTVLMSPLHVVQRPLRWLAAISRCRATTSGGPNFMYDLCVQRISDRECDGLDLSSWEVAFNGAEPIHADTLERFADKFQRAGFRRSAFLPCYGLAEATLLVSGGPRSSPPEIRTVGKTELESGEATPLASPANSAIQLVSCGRPASGHEVLTVDVQSQTPCGAARVGEIWVKGPTVARGYWNRPSETAKTFHASLGGSGVNGFLRTGDLGFVDGGQLFVTGRLKDLLIVDGRNVYPQDIELTAERAHPALRTHGGAAFSLDASDRQIVIVHEIGPKYRRYDPADIFAAIRQAVSEQHELDLHAVVLVKSGGVPKTTSGKIQRGLCRQRFCEDRLEAIARWQADDQPAADATAMRFDPTGLPQPQAAAATEPSSNAAGADDVRGIQRWLIERIAQRKDCDPSRIDIRQPFVRYGLTSRDAVELSGELEQRLQRRLSPALLYEYPTIESLADYLADPDRDAAPQVARDAGPAHHDEPIAIIGLGCRLPGAPNPDAFWQLLADGRDAITEVPPDRWDADAVDRQVAAIGADDRRGTVRWGGWLAEIDRFDAGFFGIAPREATAIDPQHRLLMELAWEALEDGGQPAGGLRGSRTGVFVGISTNDYRRNFMFRTSELDPYWSTGNASSIAAGRLSYFFDFRGPSIAVDTACSSSLVAVHWACQSLRQGECDLALTGGVNLILSPDISFSFAKGGGLAADGRCKAFDARADGIVRSEGAGMVVLKRLSRALADGDRIYAVIRASAVNQDGRSNGITAPNRAAQEDVVRTAWQRAGLSPGQAQYVETHGAGTRLGDVIEAEALGTVLAGDRKGGRRCAIGSVKTNIGHAEAAAGIAGLIKVALAMQHGQIPASIHFREPNPDIPFERMPFFVQDRLAPWPDGDGRRLAGVSSFGFGGTNAHVVMESVADLPAASPPHGTPGDGRRQPTPVHVLPLSAGSRSALAAVARRYREWQHQHTWSKPEDFHALCHAAGANRTHLDHRAGLWFRTEDELAERLAALADGQPHAGVAVGHATPGGGRRVVFVFSGHGGQWIGMHRPFFDRFERFREMIERCDALLRPIAGWSLLEELQRQPSQSRIENGEIETVQTTLFACQVAMADLWQSLGVVPGAVIGHSMGEIAAACVAGSLRLEDALRVVVHRSRLLQEAAQAQAQDTGMAAVRVSGARAKELIRSLQGRVSVAVENSPKYTVLSGERATLESLIAQLRAQRIVARMMNVPGAAHTPELEPVGRRLEDLLEDIAPEDGPIPFYSTLQADAVPGRTLNAAYWGQSLWKPVRFAPTIDRLVDEGCRMFVEVGPHPLLCAAVAQCAGHPGQQAIAVPMLRRDDPHGESLAQAIGSLYANGCDIAWERLYPDRPTKCLSLPTYPWQRQRCWLAPATATGGAAATDSIWYKQTGAAGAHPLLGSELDFAAAPGFHCWSAALSLQRLPYLCAYQLNGTVVLPAAACIEAVVAAAGQIAGSHRCLIDQIELFDALAFDAAAQRGVQMILQRSGSRQASFRFFGRQQDDSWQLHASGTVRWLSNDQLDRPATPLPEALGAQMQTASDAPTVGAAESGPPSSSDDPDGLWTNCLQRLCCDGGQALATAALPASLASESARYAIHPILLDACLSVLAAAAQGKLPASDVRYIPTALGQIIWHGEVSPDAVLWVHAVLHGNAPSAEDAVGGDVYIWDERRRPVAHVRGLRLHRVVVRRDKKAPAASTATGCASEGSAPEHQAARVLAAFRKAEAADREQLLIDYLRARIAHTLDAAPDAIDLQRPLTHLGIDSLMALEIKNRVEVELDTVVHIAQVLEGPTIGQLAGMLLEQLDRKDGAAIQNHSDQHPSRPLAPESDLTQEEATRLLENFDDFSDQEIDALMHRVLADSSDDS